MGRVICLRIKTIVNEDFSNYKKVAMFIGTISCGGKCCEEANIPLKVCQNDGWRFCATLIIDDEELCDRYINNPITQAIVFGGLEPFEEFEDIYQFIKTLRRRGCDDDVVIYTGYYPNEVESELEKLKEFQNIIVKFGRYVPKSRPVFDELLGVKLISDNQYARRIG